MWSDQPPARKYPSALAVRSLWRRSSIYSWKYSGRQAGRHQFRLSNGEERVKSADSPTFPNRGCSSDRCKAQAYRASSRALRAVDHDFLLESGWRSTSRRCPARPQPEGVHEVNVRFTLEAATDHPPVIRLSTQRAVFDGTVGLVRAILSAGEAAFTGWSLNVVAPTGAADLAA